MKPIAGSASDSIRESPGGYAVSRYRKTRHWAVQDPAGELICLAVYRKGAEEVARRLASLEAANRKEQDP